MKSQSWEANCDRSTPIGDHLKRDFLLVFHRGIYDLELAKMAHVNGVDSPSAIA